jgi:hypothetical protein
MKHLFLIILVLLTSSCNSPDSNLYKIDPRTIIENKISLSDIADDITYIPLDNSIPFTNFKYLIAQNSIYISAKGIGILQFDRDGKLIKKFGSQGRGPGEFYYGMDFTVDEKSRNVYVLDPHEIKVYSPSGIFLKAISYEEYISSHAMAGDIEIYNSLLFLPDYIMEGDSKFNWVFLDTLGNLVSEKENSVPSFQANVVREGSIYKFKNKLFYFNYFNDTIFSISPDLSYNAEYLFAQGDHRWPRAWIETNSFDQFASQISKLFQPYRMFETKQFIVLRYAYLHNEAISLIDKKTKTTFLALKYKKNKDNSVYSEACLLNDLDGGIPLKDINYYVENGEEYITELINPLDLKVYLSSDDFKKIVPKHPEKKKYLVILADSIKETDNPILMMVKLKK